MAGLNDALSIVAQELVRLQREGITNSKGKDRDAFLNFVTAASGAQVHFSKKALEAIQDVTVILYSNQTNIHQQIRREEFYKVVRQGIADCFCSGRLVDEGGVLLPDAKESLRSMALDAVRSGQDELTHYFPAWTLGAEGAAAFEIGPVRFMTREQWIETVDFSPSIKAKYDKNETDWKRDLRDILQGKADAAKLHALAADILQAVEGCPSILSITISPCEAFLSRQRARMAARTALDSLALVFDNPEMHRRYMLHDEPALPVSYSTLVGSSGSLWFPGSYKFPRGAHNSPSDGLAIVSEFSALIHACGRAISATLDPSRHRAPNLAKRWVTALRWHADGCRETDDSIAVVKHASCLDILACGGKADGIVELIGSQLGPRKDQQLFQRPDMTVDAAIRDLYNRNRSQVLHGSFADPMQSFTEQRSRATKLARILLRVVVRNWEKYIGPDSPKGFRCMGGNVANEYSDPDGS